MVAFGCVCIVAFCVALFIQIGRMVDAQWATHEAIEHLTLKQRKGVRIITRNQLILGRRLKVVEQLVRRLLPKDGFRLLYLEERYEDMKSRFRFDIGLTDVSGTDVTKRHISGLTIGDQSHADRTLDNVNSFGPFWGDQGMHVVGTIVDEDESGNKTDPVAFDLTIEDKFAPPTPGVLSLAYLEEIQVDDDEPLPSPDAPVEE